MLSRNHIEKIEADLFEFNRNVEYISLANNKINHIGSGVFNGLEKLNVLLLDSNPCLNKYKFWDLNAWKHESVLELIEKVENECKN